MRKISVKPAAVRAWAARTASGKWSWKRTAYAGRQEKEASCCAPEKVLWEKGKTPPDLRQNILTSRHRELGHVTVTV